MGYDPHSAFVGLTLNSTPLPLYSAYVLSRSLTRNPMPVLPFSDGVVSHRCITICEPFGATVTQCPSLSRISKPNVSLNQSADLLAFDTTTATSSIDSII